MRKREVMLVWHGGGAHARGMFCVDETTAAAIRQAYEEGGELAAAVELRRWFPGIADNANARRCARAIAGWVPAPIMVAGKIRRKRPHHRKAAISADQA
jgi:hypothetical protein